MYMLRGFVEAPSDFMRICKALSYINENMVVNGHKSYGVFVYSYLEAQEMMQNHCFELAVGYGWSLVELKAAVWGMAEAVGVDRDGQHFLIDCHIGIESLDHPDNYRYRESPQPSDAQIHGWRDKWLTVMPQLNTHDP